MSTGGGVWKALQRGHGIGCEVVQIFVKNNMQWLGKAYTATDLALFKEHAQTCAFSCVFGHTGYLINLGAGASPNRDKSLQSLIQEIELAGTIGLPFLVMHPGAHLGAGEEAGFDHIVAGLNEVFRSTRGSTVKVALENTAGQGTCLGHRLEHLHEIFQRVESPERLGVCLDSAHLFAAGYDIRSREVWDDSLQLIDRTIGSNNVLAFHLNDSRTDLGSRVDRHAGIGQGKIGREPFRHIVNEPRFHGLPGCLETPKSDDLREDVENLGILRSFRPLEPAAIRRGKSPGKKRLPAP